MERVLFTLPGDDTLYVLVPAPRSGVTLEQIIAKDIPASATIKVVDTADIPPTRAFRNAWMMGAAGVEIHRGKAEDITKDRLRVERVSRLAALDIAVLRAVEAGAPTAALTAEKQRLRDVTGRNFSALTLDELAVINLDGALTLPNGGV